MSLVHLASDVDPAFGKPDDELRFSNPGFEERLQLTGEPPRKSLELSAHRRWLEVRVTGSTYLTLDVERHLPRVSASARVIALSGAQSNS